ncbi:MAG: hypothetical protein NTZ90_15865 [Proteobacteria bacterium]|nr:hypothetical protein [Pseudomonadota bacterium]
MTLSISLASANGLMQQPIRFWCPKWVSLMKYFMVLSLQFIESAAKLCINKPVL